VARYFEVVDQVWATRDSEVAQEFVEGAYPSMHVSRATIEATEAWLSDPDKPAPLRRLIAEGRDGIARALKGRARDAAA
jgi:aminopeptidase N